MKLQHKITLVVTGCLTSFSIQAQQSVQEIELQSTNDPLAQTRQVYAAEHIQSIYRAESDLNNDGKAEILLGMILKDENGEDDIQDQKPVWLIYIAQPAGGYRVAVQNDQKGKERVEVLSFDQEYMSVGLIPELNRHGLLFLEAGDEADDDCQLMAIVLEDKQWKQIPVGEKGKVGTHLEAMRKRFEKPLKLTKVEPTP